MQEQLKKLTQYHGLYAYWKNKTNSLEKRENNLIVMDLDDTLFSRTEQLDKELLLQQNRGAKGNEVMINQLSLPYMISNYYNNKDYPKDILEKYKGEESLILTAGLREYQEEKVLAMGLTHYAMLVTETGEDKIIALIRYIIFNLQYIPSKIIVYEDRPQYFIEYKDMICDILGCKLEIMYVEMDSNKGYKNIEEK